MRKMTAAAATALFTISMAIAPNASATDSKNIPWFWNSDDADAKAKFVHDGDHIKLCKVGSGEMKVNWKNAGGDGDHHHDDDQHTCKDWNHDFVEGSEVELQVCQVKWGYPDDCSNWREGFA